MGSGWDDLEELQMALHTLRATTLKSLPPGFHSDGGNLYLKVSATSSSWIFRFRFGGRRHDVGLGSLNDVPLSQAREMAEKMRSDIADGIHPLSAKAEQKRKAEQEYKKNVSIVTMDKIIIDAVTERKALKRSENPEYIPSYIRAYNKYVSPIIGSKDIQLLTRIDIANVLRPIWTKNPQYASKSLSAMRACFNYLIARELYDKIPPTTWRGCLEALLPPFDPEINLKHHKSLDWKQIPDFYKHLCEIPQHPSVRALRFITLSALRVTAAASIKFEDVDIDAGCINVHLRKNKRLTTPFLLPITSQMKMFLTPYRLGDQWLFQAGFSQPVSERTILGQLVRNTPFDTTIHGLRASFSTWCADNEKDPTLRERCLDHVVEGRIVRAYQRSDQLELRRKLLQEWNDYVTSKL